MFNAETYISAFLCCRGGDSVMAGSAAGGDGDAGDALAVSVSGEMVARDQMDHRSRRSRLELATTWTTRRVLRDANGLVRGYVSQTPASPSWAMLTPVRTRAGWGARAHLART